MDASVRHCQFGVSRPQIDVEIGNSTCMLLQIIQSLGSRFSLLTSSFYSSGITSVGNGWWFGGDSDNSMW